LPNNSVATAPRSARDWLGALARYRDPDPRRSVLELAITVLPLAGLWVAAWAALSVSYALTLALSVPAAGFLVRLFLIQHDCGHGSFLRTKRANDWVGRVLGVLTLTPYDVWRHSHAIHHASSGHLGRRGIGDIDTLTVREYAALSWRSRLLYRLYRHPLVLFGLGPAALFLLMHRLPLGHMRSGAIFWWSAMGTNAGIAIVLGLLVVLVGPVPFLMVHLPIVLIAASIGVWLFYVQHQFEDTVWADEPEWVRHDAALYGSSHYDLPPVLAWFTANIGIHHVHHLYNRIPYYRLPQVLRDFPELGEVHRMTLRDSLACTRLRLWCEERRKLVSFREAWA
jgi:omega-6 fatty acid desaturase (delta-12 desaturase)